jgi:hypothetical protein
VFFVVWRRWKKFCRISENFVCCLGDAAILFRAKLKLNEIFIALLDEVIYCQEEFNGNAHFLSEKLSAMQK